MDIILTVFNDPLTKEQCSRLLNQVATQTDFPFQCAHGRPSMVPLCRLPSSVKAQPIQGSTASSAVKGGRRRRKVDWTRIKGLEVAAED